MPRCRRCNRELKRDPYAQMGIGRICAAKERNEQGWTETMQFLENFPMLTEGNPVFVHDGAVLFRNGNRMGHKEDGTVARCFTNIPNIVGDKYQTGYEWGYAGTGPTYLALNIIENYLCTINWDGSRVKIGKEGSCFRLSVHLRHAFKEDFLAGMDEHGGTIPYDHIKTWVDGYLKDHPEIVEYDAMYKDMETQEVWD